MKASIYFRDFNGISQRHRHELRLRVQLGVHRLEVEKWDETWLESHKDETWWNIVKSHKASEKNTVGLQI